MTSSMSQNRNIPKKMAASSLVSQSSHPINVKPLSISSRILSQAKIKPVSFINVRQVGRTSQSKISGDLEQRSSTNAKEMMT